MSDEAPQGGAPSLEMNPHTGEIMIGWPEGRPDVVTLPADAWEAIYGWHNKMIRLIRLQGAIIASLDVEIQPPRRMRHEAETLRKEMQIP